MSMVASTWLRVGSAVSSIRVPVRPLKLPFTLEIIMCFTLNSACECAGSIFQVMVVAGLASVVIVINSYGSSGLGSDARSGQLRPSAWRSEQNQPHTKLEDNRAP